MRKSLSVVLRVCLGVGFFNIPETEILFLAIPSIVLVVLMGSIPCLGVQYLLTVIVFGSASLFARQLAKEVHKDY